MTSGETPTGPSATKLGGYALIGVGALSAVLGVATLVSGGGSDSAQSPPPGGVPNSPPSSLVAEPPPPGENSQSAQPPGGEEPAAQPPAGEQPPAARPPAGDRPDQHSQPPAQDRPTPPNGAGQNETAPKVLVRVYNNSTIKGLAHRAAEDFRAVGYEVPEVGNYSAGRIYTTTVYFRPGTPEEDQARAVAAHFGARVEPRFEGIEKASPGVIVIVTNDYKGPASGK